MSGFAGCSCPACPPHGPTPVARVGREARRFYMCRTDRLPDQHAPRVWDRAGGKRDRQRQTDRQTLEHKQLDRHPGGQTKRQQPASRRERPADTHTNRRPAKPSNQHCTIIRARGPPPPPKTKTTAKSTPPPPKTTNIVLPPRCRPTPCWLEGLFVRNPAKSPASGPVRLEQPQVY